MQPQRRAPCCPSSIRVKAARRAAAVLPVPAAAGGVLSSGHHTFGTRLCDAVSAAAQAAFRPRAPSSAGDQGKGEAADGRRPPHQAWPWRFGHSFRVRPAAGWEGQQPVRRNRSRRPAAPGSDPAPGEGPRAGCHRRAKGPADSDLGAARLDWRCAVGNNGFRLGAGFAGSISPPGLFRCVWPGCPLPDSRHFPNRALPRPRSGADFREAVPFAFLTRLGPPAAGRASMIPATPRCCSLHRWDRVQAGVPGCSPSEAGGPRATTAQEMLRTKTTSRTWPARRASQHFFEMPQTFSFGDYFKAEAICLAWSFHRAVSASDAGRFWW